MMFLKTPPLVPCLSGQSEQTRRQEAEKEASTCDSYSARTGVRSDPSGSLGPGGPRVI